MTTPDDLGLDTPTGSDLIAEGDDNISRNALVLAQLYDELRDDIAEADPFKGAVPNGSNIDTFRGGANRGYWNISTNNNAETMTGLPEPVAGVLHVLAATGHTSTTGVTTQIYAPYTFGATDPRLWVRTSADAVAGTFTPWVDVSYRPPTVTPWGRGVIPLNSDLNDMRGVDYAGAWAVNSNTQAQSHTNYPSGYAGTVEIVVAGSITTQTVRPYAWDNPNRPQVFVRTVSNITGPVWTPWVDIAAQTSGGGGGDSLPGHDVARGTAIRRRGGTIGTGGRAVVALRYDHGTANFRDKVLPLLRQHGLPSSICFNSRRWHLAEHDGLTGADVEPWCLEDGIEVWNHSATHQDSTGEAAIFDNIVTGLAELRAQFPLVAIDGWMPPGVTSTNPDGAFDGLNNGSTDEHWRAWAGQLILAHHGFATGYLPGTVWPADGQPIIGLRHHGIDQGTLSGVQDAVGEAIATGGRIEIFLHPSVVDTAGFITAATLASILAWIADQRDAGAIEVLTVGGLMVADSRADHRDDMLPPMGSAANLSASEPWTRQAPLTRRPMVRGGVRRIEVDIEATIAGTVTIEVEGCGTKTLTLPAGRHVLARHVTIPLNASRCWVQVTPSVAATVHQIAAKAA